MALGLLPALALACVLAGNWAVSSMSGVAVERLQLQPGAMLVDVPMQPVRIVGELEPVEEGQFSPFMMHVQQSLAMKVNGKQRSCYNKICKKCWNECNEVMGQCIGTDGYGPPGSVCTKVWHKKGDCTKSLKQFEIGGGSEYLNRDPKYHFTVAAWSKCAHGTTPYGKTW